MNKFILNLQFIFMPSFWMMNYGYSPIHDKILNELMDKYTFTNITRCRANLGDTKIWIANYPYAVGIDSISNMSRPSRLTILRMHKKLMKECIPKDVIETPLTHARKN